MFLGLKSVAKDLKMDLGRVVVITAKSFLGAFIDLVRLRESFVARVKVLCRFLVLQIFNPFL